MAKPRMTNEHKNWLRDNLVNNMEHTFKMSHDTAVAAVTGGSVPMFVDIARRMVRNTPQYATTHSFGPEAQDWFDAVRKAFGEWIAYKAGVRPEDGAEAVPEPVVEASAEPPPAEPAPETAPEPAPEQEQPTTETAPVESAEETTEETAPDTL